MRNLLGPFIAKTFHDSGNHDYEGGDNNDYFGYFGLPAPMAKRTGYYGDQNGWTVFALNSNIDATAASSQAQ
jgi:hypothetical protein